MVTINMTEFRRNLPSYLDDVEQGETILITVRGKVVARLVPEGEPAEMALDRIRAYRHAAIVNDVVAPLDLTWSGDIDHV
jgi:prevent-host-death family protein